MIRESLSLRRTAMACALAMALLLPGVAFAHQPAEDAEASTEPMVMQDESAEAVIALDEESEKASSINLSSAPQATAKNEREFVPYPIYGMLGYGDARVMHDKVNGLRSDLGVESLAWSNELNAAAMQRAAEIAFYFAHRRPDGSDITTVSDQVYGENIYCMTARPSPQSVDFAFEAWCNSEGHYKNMTNGGWESMGVGYFAVDGVNENGSPIRIHCWVQLFSPNEPTESPDYGYDRYETMIVPLATDAAASVNSDVSEIALGAKGYAIHPTISIDYRQTNSVAEDGYAIIPGGRVSWTGIAGFVSPQDDSLVTYLPNNGTLIGKGKLGSTLCTTHLSTAPSLSCDFTVTTSPLARLAGESSSDTAALISYEGFASSDYAVIARNDDFADAMSATGLAGVHNCPILLTSNSRLSGSAAIALMELGVKKAYIVGGPGAVLPQVEENINAYGIETERVYGEYAWDTSVKCAEKISELGGNPNGEAIVAMSTNFQDALSISPLAYHDSIPILLQGDGSVEPRALTEDEIAYLKFKTDGTIWVPGGPVAVPEETVEGILGPESEYDREIVRMYGEDGYDTSLEIANTLVGMGRANANNVVIASGAQGPKGVDALAGSALAGKNGGVILLANANPDIEGMHTEAVDGFLLDEYRGPEFVSSFINGTGRGYLLGGGFVMPNAYEVQLAHALNNMA